MRARDSPTKHAAGELILIGSTSTNWRRGAFAVSASVAIFAVGFASGMRVHASKQAAPGDSKRLAARLDSLDTAVKQLTLIQKQPSEIIASSRNSVCFIVSTYTLRDARGGVQAHNKHRLLATGFLIPGNRVVSNRHVLEPWFGDPPSEAAIHAGLVPYRERLTAYFPGSTHGVELSNIVVSKAADVAVATVKLPPGMNVRPLPLASQPSSPGEPVVVMGYPLGVTTMLAKSTTLPYHLSGLRQSQSDVDHLAQFKLIRPSATQGHIVDANGMMLMYDASTAHGSSGGPVFNLQGKVVGINAALIDGFNGSSLGVSTAALQPLLTEEK